jgi:ketosteroid isomerase-like protein
MSIEEAKAVVRDHEELTAAADLEGILTNMDTEVTFLAPDAPLVEGVEAVRGLYEAILGMADWKFRHDYSHESESGDLVFLHGVARGTMTPRGQEPAPISNNFMITMRRDSDGRYRIWRAAFAPSGE